MSQGVVVEKAGVVLTTDTKGLEQGFRNAVAASNKAKSQILKAASIITVAFAGKKLFGDFLQSDSIGKFAATLDVNVQDIDAWGKAIEDNNGSAETFRNTLSTLNRGLQEVAKTGKGRAKIGLDALGISAKGANGKAKSVIDVLDELSLKADKLDKAQFAGLAQKLGLDEGTIRLLQTGNKSLKEQIELLKQKAIKEDDVKVAELFNKALTEIKRSVQGVANSIFRLLIPPATKVIGIFTKGIDYIHKNKNVALAFISILAGLIGGKLVLAVRAFTASLLANPAVLIITAIIAIIAALIFIVEDLYTYFTGGESILGEWLKKFDVNSPVELFNKIRDSLLETFPFLNLIIDAFNFLFSIFDTGAQLFGNLVETIIDGFKSILQNETVKKVIGWFTKLFGGGDESIDANINEEPFANVSPELAAAASVPGADLNDLAQMVNNETNTTIQNVTINTQATDAEGIASEIPGATKNAFAKDMAAQAASSTRG